MKSDTTEDADPASHWRRCALATMRLLAGIGPVRMARCRSSSRPAARRFCGVRRVGSAELISISFRGISITGCPAAASWGTMPRSWRRRTEAAFRPVIASWSSRSCSCGTCRACRMGLHVSATTSRSWAPTSRAACKSTGPCPCHAAQGFLHLERRSHAALIRAPGPRHPRCEPGWRRGR